MENDEIKYLNEALDYASRYIEKTKLPTTPCKLLAFTMAYHLSFELNNNEIMEILKDA